MADFELYEALLWEPDRGYFLLERHLARVAASAAFFGRPFEERVVREALEAHARTQHAAHKARLIVARDGTPRVEAAPLKPSARVRAVLAREPIDADDVFLRHKTSRREVYARALAAHPEADDVILWNGRGELTETCTANLVLTLDDRALTPHASAGLLPGTYRGELLACGEIAEAVLVVEDLQRATRIELVNSVRKRCEIALLAKEHT